MPEIIKLEQWPVQSQPAHCKCKWDKNSDTCAADINQISIWLANKARNKITEIMICSKSTANISGSWKQNDTDGVCWWHWTDHYVVQTYAMFSKYWLAQSPYVEAFGHANQHTYIYMCVCVCIYICILCMYIYIYIYIIYVYICICMYMYVYI